MSARLGALDFVDSVVDPGTFISWDEPINLSGVDAGYVAELDRAAEAAGTDEAVVTGRASIHGRDVAVIAGEFGFLAGSIGLAAARRVVTAFQRATREGLPVVAAPCSGGTRMQEGTPAFVQMVAITQAVVKHKSTGLPYLVYLRHPTTGGVFASWGSLGHVTYAEPGALVGFLGPRVYQALYGEAFPEGVQRSENLATHGIVDDVATPRAFRDQAGRILSLLDPARPVPASRTEHLHPVTDPSGPVWRAVLSTRSELRPGIRELLRDAADDVIHLGGTGAGERDAGIVLAIASLGGIPCVVVGQDREAQLQIPLGPAALRQARRGMRLAQDLSLPLVTVIDTPGADLSQVAEEGALAGEIARCLADMVSLTVPRVSVLMGQGCGGAALALWPADRVIAAEDAWLSPLPPEGAATIVHRDPARAPEMAQHQRIGAAELVRAGIVDVIVGAGRGIEADPSGFVRRLVAACATQLDLLLARRGAA
ncbi:acetyl-CoA carboxyl transferase [Nocardioides immobilis]|uniref:Acetyl-CoA carboxyl transferase n=1 Tax=Nocardioides immobilis TaxID=2049295 RepID=A0A417Y722_9ACTN|nr:carboxyl transferase domain-containing protein [Nocardioides immobilis]RHW28483.1 acetyl-CoA carboxyl transferase [Nocardioides immobilis]